MNKNIEYVTKVGWYILGCKKLMPPQYIHYMAMPMTPLDEMGLVLFARMKKIHIAFLMSEKYWTTQQNHEFKNCKIFLAFRGNLTFNDIRQKQVVIPKPLPAPVPDKHEYGLCNREKNKSSAPPPPPPSRHKNSPPTSPPGKVVIRTQGLPKNKSKCMC